MKLLVSEAYFVTWERNEEVSARALLGPAGVRSEKILNRFSTSHGTSLRSRGSSYCRS